MLRSSGPLFVPSKKSKLFEVFLAEEGCDRCGYARTTVDYHEGLGVESMAGISFSCLSK
jgi:hypothetical protein